ncbi:MAG TPA: hypothetical protein VGO50_00850 [Pyrinomonadaceae bacterium]|jgi:flagellar biosynthesis/type III secretory pathway protein FliH|nr:hypothetical protein [Pyrinomonadaceae bacterium]
MKLFNLKRTLGISALGLVTLLGTSQIASAQYGTYNKQNKKVVKQQQKIAKQQQKIQQLQTRNRYRVYHNGSYYQTDNRGAELLRQAVNKGYQQGFNAGKNDRSYRRGGSYNNSSMYRSGNYGYQSYVDSSQYQYYFREGFKRGYEDGYNSRYQYGSNNNGGVNILGTILQQVLNIQNY